MLPMPIDRTLSIEMKGVLADRVQIAETFRQAYHVLDKLCQQEVEGLLLVYHSDFCVPEELRSEFQVAAREALAYKEALSFGRQIATKVIGVDRIADSATRTMAASLHLLN